MTDETWLWRAHHRGHVAEATAIPHAHGWQHLVRVTGEALPASVVVCHEFPAALENASKAALTEMQFRGWTVFAD
jgi:hypothetical protein